MSKDDLYSLENARRFGWASITGQLNPARVSVLEAQLVGEKILDAGCSGGAYAEFAASLNHSVVGVDRYEAFLKLALQGTHCATYVQGDLMRLPFADRTFDSTYCFDVLEHVDDEAALRELARVTRKRLILVVPQENLWLEKYGLTFYHYIDPTHLRYYTEESFGKLIAKINPAQITLIPDQPVHWNMIIRDMVEEEIPPMQPSAMLSPSVILRAVKYLAEGVTDRKGFKLKSSLAKAKRNSFIKQLSGISFKPIYMELIAIVELAQ
jgi:SAM-dependent methyltransferase